MKIRMLCLALAVLLMSTASFAIPALIQFGNLGFALTKDCNGGDPLPDGVPIVMYVAATNLPAPLAPGGECSAGVLGDWTGNMLWINAGAWDPETHMYDGMFWQEDFFVSCSDLPPNNVVYIIVEWNKDDAYTVREGDSLCTYHHKTVWKSKNFTVVGGENPTFMCDMASDWTCTEVTVKDGCVYDPIITCVPTLNTWFSPAPPQAGHYMFHECIQLCDPQTHTVCVGPLPKANRIPHGFFIPGCDMNTPCYPHEACDPATGWTTGDVTGALNFSQWVEIPVGSGLFYYCATIVAGPEATDGCGCVFIDWIEPVDMGEMDVVAMDNAVKVSWNTLAETDFASFEIWRDDVKVTTINAHGGATGHDYTYTDAVENGRTYKYELKTVDLNGASASVYTESVTPSFDNAVVTEYALHQNYPNPFNPSTRIAFDVVNSNPVSLTIYNATGQEVATLLNNVTYSTGRYNINFDATNLTSGLYFYTVKIGSEFSATKKMLLVK